jgi:hypothetical protein
MRCLDNTLSKPNNTLFLLVKIRFLIVALVLSFLSGVSYAQNAEDLWIYVQNDRADQVSALLEQGLDPNVTTDIGNPLLMQAVRDNSWAVFDLVLKHPDTDIKITNGYQETPLMYVSLVGDLQRTKTLVERGATVNHLGWTPLHYAASKGQVDVVEYLLAKGAMPNAPAPNGTSPIMMAARAGAIDTVQRLLDAGADPAAIDINGDDAAAAARLQGNTRLADSLQAIIDKRQKK